MSCKWLSLYPLLLLFTASPNFLFPPFQLSSPSFQFSPSLLLPLASSLLTTPITPPLSSAPNTAIGIKSQWQIWWQMFTVKQNSQIAAFPMSGDQIWPKKFIISSSRRRRDAVMNYSLCSQYFSGGNPRDIFCHFYIKNPVHTSYSTSSSRVSPAVNTVLLLMKYSISLSIRRIQHIPNLLQLSNDCRSVIFRAQAMSQFVTRQGTNLQQCM